jgi:hypothetical protein
MGQAEPSWGASGMNAQPCLATFVGGLWAMSGRSTEMLISLVVVAQVHWPDTHMLVPPAQLFAVAQAVPSGTLAPTQLPESSHAGFCKQSLFAEQAVPLGAGVCEQSPVLESQLAIWQLSLAVHFAAPPHTPPVQVALPDTHRLLPQSVPFGASTVPHCPFPQTPTLHGSLLVHVVI